MNKRNNELKVLGVIPARGGSKGVPRKNIRMLAGKPLIGYTIEACQQSKLLHRFVVSTEDFKIRQIAKSYNCTVIDRPENLALDSTPSFPVILHAALATASKFAEDYDAICLLQPTTPQRRGVHIDHAIERFKESTADTLLSVSRVPEHFHPNWVFISSENQELERACHDTPMISRRQDLPPAFIRNGAIYITRWDTLVSGQTLYGSKLISFEMPIKESLNIDTLQDWQRAEKIFATKAKS